MARLRVNYVCLIGLAIGMISLLGSWARYDYPFPSWRYSHFGYPDVAVPTLFLLGVLISLVTPLGGILQMMSSIDFVLAWHSTDIYGYHVTIFPIIGIFSSVVVLYSIRTPLWIHRDDTRERRLLDSVHLARRLLTFSLIDEKSTAESLS